MAKVMITGATGFLGAYLVKYFCTKGFDVVAFGRNEKARSVLEGYGAVFHKGDLMDLTALENASDMADIIVHSAALSTVWGPWNDFYNANVLGTRNVLTAALKRNVKRVVHISSPSIYSCSKDQLNVKEMDYDENNDLNNYIKSKIMAEKEVESFFKQGLSTVVIRPKGLFGIGDTSIIPRVLKTNKRFGIPLLNGGNGFVDMTYVENVAHAVYLAATASGVEGEAFNITNGEPMPLKQMIEILFQKIGSKPKFVPVSFTLLYAVAQGLEFIYKTMRLKGEPAFTRYTVSTLGFSQTLDINKARTLLGYRPLYSIEEGLETYGKWYIENVENC